MFTQNIQRILFFTLNLLLFVYSSNLLSMLESSPSSLIMLDKQKSITFPEGTIISGISPDGTQYAVATTKGLFLYDSFESTEPKELFCTKKILGKETLKQQPVCCKSEHKYKILFDNKSLVALMIKARSSDIYFWNCRTGEQQIEHAANNLGREDIRFAHNNASYENNDIIFAKREGEFNIIPDYNHDRRYTIEQKRRTLRGCNMAAVHNLIEWSPNNNFLFLFSNHVGGSKEHELNELCMIDRSTLLPIKPQKKHAYIEVTDKKIVCTIEDEQIYSIAWNHDSTLAAALSLRNFTLFNNKGKDSPILKDCEHSQDSRCITEHERYYDDPVFRKIKACTPLICPAQIAFSTHGIKQCFVEQVKKGGILVITIDDNTSNLIALENRTLGTYNENDAQTIFTLDGSKLIVLENNKLFCYESSTGALVSCTDIEKVDSTCSLQWNSEGTILFLSHAKGIDQYMFSEK